MKLTATDQSLGALASASLTFEGFGVVTISQEKEARRAHVRTACHCHEVRPNEAEHTLTVARRVLLVCSRVSPLVRGFAFCCFTPTCTPHVKTSNNLTHPPHYPLTHLTTTLSTVYTSGHTLQHTQVTGEYLTNCVRVANDQETNHRETDDLSTPEG